MTIENIGARRLHSLIEKIVADASFNSDGELKEIIVDD